MLVINTCLRLSCKRPVSTIHRSFVFDRVVFIRLSLPLVAFKVEAAMWLSGLLQGIVQDTGQNLS